jgi:membrane-associated phospholipid phosphatase
VQGTRRQRRPTGAPPPLPHPIAVSTTAWVLLAVVIVAFAFVFSEVTPWRRSGDQASTWVLLRLADARTPWLTDAANGINAAGSGWGVSVLGVSVVVLIMVFRRWRHLAVFLGSLFFLEVAGGQLIYNGLTRPRPYGVLIIGSWGGYSAPSVPVAAVTIFLIGAVYGLVVPGRPRACGKAAAAGVIAVFALARLYLPVGLESSAGSTPLRLRIEKGPEEYLFAKLYTKGHVRADRGYKMWRMIRYGSLEDEHPFQSVRRLAEYEDHMMRLLRDAGIRTARPYGIMEITPEREDMIVTEFFSGAVELGDADIDDDVIDQGLQLVRKLWDAGIAHRDIKRAGTLGSRNCASTPSPGLRQLPVQLRGRRVAAARKSCERRGRLHAPGRSGEPRPEHRGPGVVRAGRGMSRVSRPAAARRPEETILGAPIRDVAVTAAVLTLSAVACAAVADHGVLAHIQRVDHAWLRLMVSGRGAPVTVIAKFFNVLGLVYVTLPVRIAIAGYLVLRRRWWHMAAFVAAVVASEVLIGMLKNVYDRARPPGSLVATSGASFPSRHAIDVSVTVVAAVIALVPPGRRRVAWGLAAVGFSVLMAASRAYLAAHWLSDAIAGILLGTSCALLAAVVTDGLQQRWRARRAGGASGPARARVPDTAWGADRP